MHHIKAILFISIFVYFACKNSQSANKPPFTTRSYVDIGKIFDSIQPPYIIDLSEGKKRLIFVGCAHQADSTHVQFSEIERLFQDLQPQIAFNEGGQFKDSTRYNRRNEAIRKEGEAGILKFLCDKQSIKMMNGDLADSLEFKLTLQKHSKEEMWLYYVVERIGIPYKYGGHGKKPFEAVFNDLVQNYFVKNGFPLTEDEKKLDFFKMLYKKYTGQIFKIEALDVESFDYVNDNCAFCAIARTSKMVRDSVLLSKIDKALDNYDRVFVTFGHGHALAIELALKEIMQRKLVEK